MLLSSGPTKKVVEDCPLITGRRIACESWTRGREALEEREARAWRRQRGLRSKVRA